MFFSSIKINSLSLHLFKVGAEIVRKSLTYPLKLNAQNVDVSVRVITEMVQTQICSQVPVSQKFFTNSISPTKFLSYFLSNDPFSVHGTLSCFVRIFLLICRLVVLYLHHCMVEIGTR